MIEKSTLQKVLELFFENPRKELHLRELSRELGLSMPTIISSTDILAKEQLIVKKKGSVLTQVKANRDNPDFIRHKRVYNLERIYSSGIIDYLISEYNHPKIIILFGSYSRGEDIENSDIDIAVTTTKKMTLNLSRYEKIFNKPINIHEISLNKTSEEFRMNLANGIVLEGTW